MTLGERRAAPPPDPPVCCIDQGAVRLLYSSFVGEVHAAFEAAFDPTLFAARQGFFWPVIGADPSTYIQVRAGASHDFRLEVHEHVVRVRWVGRT